MKKSLMMIIIISAIVSIIVPVGLSYGLNHIDESDPDWKCKKAVGMVELAKQDYTNFVEETLWLAEKQCGFSVDELTS